jgi:hypothetical protein
MSEENVELVRRWYRSLPDLRDTNPDNDRETIDQAFRDYLDEQHGLRLPAGYPEGEGASGVPIELKMRTL